MPIELQIETEGCPDGLAAFLGRVADACMEIEGIEGGFFGPTLNCNITVTNVDADCDFFAVCADSFRQEVFIGNCSCSQNDTVYAAVKIGSDCFNGADTAANLCKEIGVFDDVRNNA